MAVVLDLDVDGKSPRFSAAPRAKPTRHLPQMQSVEVGTTDGACGEELSVNPGEAEAKVAVVVVLDPDAADNRDEEMTDVADLGKKKCGSCGQSKDSAEIYGECKSIMASAHTLWAA